MTRRNTRLARTVPAVGLVLMLTCGTQVFAQNSDPGSQPKAGEPPSTSPTKASPAPGAENAPAPGAGGMTVGRVPGHTGQLSTVEEKTDPVVQESEKEVSRRIKNICRGC